MWIANVSHVERIHTTEEQAETAAQRSFVLDTPPHPRNWHRIINYIGIVHFSVAQNCNVIHRTKLFAVTPRGNYFELIKGNFLFSSLLPLNFPLQEYQISDHRPFLDFHESALSKCEQLKFVRYLGQGLSNLTLNKIYVAFKDLLGNGRSEK